MALIYSTTPHDTDELVALRQVINDNEREAVLLTKAAFSKRLRKVPEDEILALDAAGAAQLYADLLTE